MIKSEELSNPNSCLNKAKDDEILFVLLDRDLAFADTVRYWIEKRIQFGLNKREDLKMIEAANCVQKVLRKQQERIKNG